jgi:ABC-type siderophore export system fused ATPase/permease subunit
MELLEDLNEDGKTIIMVTHDPHDAQYAEYIVDITDGVTKKKKKEDNYELAARRLNDLDEEEEKEESADED